MKLNRNFISHNTEGESLLVPTGNAAFSGLVRGNKTLGAILDLLKTDTTEEAVIAALCTRFDAEEELITRDVRRALAELRNIGALDE